MPTAPLLVFASPMLLGPVPAAALIEVDMPTAPVSQVEAQSTIQPEILPIAWTLARQQDQATAAQSTDPVSAEESNPDDQSEIVVEGEYGPVETDPMGAFNETSYRITQDLDQALVEPVAYAYRDGLPDPLRNGLGNVVRNLREPANFLNFLLQLKIGKAFETLGRFAINSTLGVGGLFDIAEKPGIGLPYRRNGFANTLGYYGVDTGAYLYLPITGATTVRDLFGDTLDQFVLPVAVGKPFNTVEYAAPYFLVSNLDARLEVDEELDRIGETVDPYATRRDTYLYRRERDIAQLRGQEPPQAPTILREIEEGVDALDIEVNDAEAAEPPSISYENTLEMPHVAMIAITRPTGR